MYFSPKSWQECTGANDINLFSELEKISQQFPQLYKQSKWRSSSEPGSPAVPMHLAISGTTGRFYYLILQHLWIKFMGNLVMLLLQFCLRYVATAERHNGHQYSTPSFFLHLLHTYEIFLGLFYYLSLKEKYVFEKCLVIHKGKETGGWSGKENV